MSDNKRPTHDMLVVVDTKKPVEGETYTKKIWNKIGSCWFDGETMSCKAFAMPVGGNFEVRPVKEKKAEDES